MLSNCGAGEDSWVPWTARWANQSILKEINHEYSLEGLTLKCQHFGHLMREEPTHWKRPWCWERLKTKGEGDDRMRWLDSITDSVDMNLSTLWDSGGAWCAQSRRSQKSWTQLSDRTTVTTRCLKADSPVLFRPTLVGTARQDADQKLHYVLISKRKTKTNQETHKTQKYSGRLI